MHHLVANFSILHSRNGLKNSRIHEIVGKYSDSQNKPFVSRNSMETQQIEMQIRDLDKEDDDYYNQLKTAIQQEQFNMAESRHGDIKVDDSNELKNK